jgi:hypothetical protein
VKYFTPELLAECRSLDSDVAEEAALEWQKRASAYRERILQLKKEARLPFGVQHVMRHTTLHDANLLALHFAKVRGQTSLLLTFRLAGGDGRRGVQLCYMGLAGLSIVPHQANTSGDTELFALYDEFDVSADDTVTHSILMTGGLEIRIRFAKLIVTDLTKVVVPARGRSSITEELAEMAD